MQKSLDGQIGDMIAEWTVSSYGIDVFIKRLVEFIKTREELCRDEGCPQHGIEHVCVGIHPDQTEPMTVERERFLFQEDGEFNGNIPEWYPVNAKFKFGETVQKIKGSSWRGTVVGWYSTELTPSGFAVESYYEKGSVQIYPENALTEWTP